MNREALQAYFRFGIWVTAISLILVLALPHDDAGYVVSVCSLGVGIALLSLTLIVSRLLK